VLWGATFRIVMSFLETVFGFSAPSMDSLPVISKTLDERYLMEPRPCFLISATRHTDDHQELSPPCASLSACRSSPGDRLFCAEKRGHGLWIEPGAVCPGVDKGHRGESEGACSVRLTKDLKIPGRERADAKLLTC